MRSNGRDNKLTKLVADFARSLLDGEFNSPPSPPIHTILPSGIAVIGIDSWVERFTLLFNRNFVEELPGHSPVSFLPGVRG